MRKSLKLAALAIMLGCTAAQADTLPKPIGSYAADITSDIGTQHSTGTINAAGPQIRLSVLMSNNIVTLLINRASNQTLLIVPALGTAVPVTSQMMGGFDLNSLNTVPVTQEADDAVYGVEAMRYAVNAPVSTGTFVGHIWATQDGAILAIDGTQTTFTESKPIKIVLSNFQRGPQSPLLFIPPVGIRQVGPGLAGILGAQRAVSAPGK